jgi:hypothetical protein
LPAPSDASEGEKEIEARGGDGVIEEDGEIDGNGQSPHQHQQNQHQHQKRPTAAQLAWEEARSPLLSYISGYDRSSHWKARLRNYTKEGGAVVKQHDDAGSAVVLADEVPWEPMGPADCNAVA